MKENILIVTQKELYNNIANHIIILISGRIHAVQCFSHILPPFISFVQILESARHHIHCHFLDSVELLTHLRYLQLVRLI